MAKKSRAKNPKKQRKPYWIHRADNGTSYVISNIDWDSCTASVSKMKDGFPDGRYMIASGACNCRGYSYRGKCSHVDFLSLIVDSREVPMQVAKAVCTAVVEGRSLKNFKAEVIETDGMVQLLHIQAKMRDLPETRVVEWYSGLAVVTDINSDCHPGPETDGSIQDRV